MKVSSDQIVVSVFITPKTQTVIIIIPKEFLVLVAPRARFFYSGFWDLGSGILLPDSCSTDTGDGYSFYVNIIGSPRLQVGLGRTFIYFLVSTHADYMHDHRSPSTL